LNFDGGFGLVDGGLGEGDEEADEGPEGGKDDPGALVKAEDAPIFQQAAGFRIFVGGFGRDGGIRCAIATVTVR
jgi:hypothetical protein